MRTVSVPGRDVARKTLVTNSGPVHGVGADRADYRRTKASSRTRESRGAAGQGTLRNDPELGRARRSGRNKRKP